MKVLVIFGGRSSEHEVSVSSARAVVSALVEAGHDPTTVGISRSGEWFVADPFASDTVSEDGESFEFSLSPKAPRTYDVVFPVLHGPFGEDGSIQGALELASVPYVGSGVQASAVAMDKVVHKTLFRDAGLPTVAFVSFHKPDWEADPRGCAARVAALGFPSFIKPSRMGSSVGISKVQDRSEIEAAVERALKHDSLVIAEARGGARELEVGVLRGNPPEVSVVGEIISEGDFYDYSAKYADAETTLIVPADVPAGVAASIRSLAQRAFTVCGCEGLARVDFFFNSDSGELHVNEINSMPGITSQSMFPRAWEASGVPLSVVVDRLVCAALEVAKERSKLEVARLEAHAEEIAQRSRAAEEAPTENKTATPARNAHK